MTRDQTRETPAGETTSDGVTIHDLLARRPVRQLRYKGNQSSPNCAFCTSRPF
jgi:hypothetical protein